MVIAVDAAGGDYYPKNPVRGAVEAITEMPELEVLLVGDKNSVSSELSKYSTDNRRVHIVHAPEVIGMDESPSTAVKKKQDSSIVVGLQAHKQGDCQAFVSAGNTGALLAASVFILGKLPGVNRPTIAAAFPTLKGFRLLLDAGANLELKPETFLQFAKMGSVYSSAVMGVENPKIGLLNVGKEKEKGTDLLKESYERLSILPGFLGNVEGGDIFSARADIFLCDGYLGNVLLKFGESITTILEHKVSETIREIGMDSDSSKQVLNVLKRSLHSFNYEHVGGVPFLGVNGVSMVGHGGSTPAAIRNMILNAVRSVRTGVNEKIVFSLKINSTQ